MCMNWRYFFLSYFSFKFYVYELQFNSIQFNGNDDNMMTPRAVSKSELPASDSRIVANADGRPVELIKSGGDELIRGMQQLINKIWLVECMPEEWNLSILCPILK